MSTATSPSSVDELTASFVKVGLEDSDVATEEESGACLIGFRRAGDEPSPFVPAFTYIEIEVGKPPNGVEYLDTLQFRWFMGAQYYPYPELIAITTGRQTARVLIPLQRLPRDAAIGVSAYGLTVNDPLDGAQKVQTQVGTGWFTVSDLYNSLHAQSPLVVPVINEASHTECVLLLKALKTIHPWKYLADEKANEEYLETPASREHSVLVEGWVAEAPRPVLDPAEVLPTFYRLDDLERYRRTQVGSIFPAHPSVVPDTDPRDDSTRERWRVPFWMYALAPGETRTPEAFYVQAFEHALTVCGLTRDEFLAHPDIEVLVQVLGYFAWSCPYEIDREAIGGAVYDQCGLVRDIPNPRLRAGDCEDLAREMFLAFWWLRKRTDLQDPGLQQLQHWVHAYQFVFVDILAEQGTVLHMAARLVPRSLEEAVDLPTSDLPILYLEPTERVWGTRKTPSVLEVPDKASTSMRSLHPFSKVDSWYVQDLAYYCDEWTEVRAPIREGLHPREFRGRYAPMPHYIITKGYQKVAEWFWDHSPPVSLLQPAKIKTTGTAGVAGSTSHTGAAAPAKAHQCIYIQGSSVSTDRNWVQSQAALIFADTVMGARLYNPVTQQYEAGAYDEVVSLVTAYPVTVVDGHTLYCVYAQLST